LGNWVKESIFKLGGKGSAYIDVNDLIGTKTNDAGDRKES
jgi:hypothetical protein